jgi:hypothetical protein
VAYIAADVTSMARDERTEMADFLASLRSEQWDQPSLCLGWRLREVAAHAVSYEGHGLADLIKRLARARFRPGRLNEVALAEYEARDPQELVAFLRNHLTPRTAALRAAFAVTAPPLRGFWHARGARLVATDLDWSRGRGPEARGTAEAILMVLAGRPGVATELTGRGASILRARLG